MPRRDFSRDRVWLFPPRLDELIDPTHPVRFVAEFIDGLPRSTWVRMGIDLDGAVRGRASYSVRALLGVLVYGFMTRVREMRKLEQACRENLCFLWIAGLERPDHNTIWRFYRTHRDGLSALLRETVQTAFQTGQIELVIQALDGTKVRANAARRRSRTWFGLADLLAKTDEQIALFEAENCPASPEFAAPPPPALTRQQRKRARIVAAMARLGPPKATPELAPGTELATGTGKPAKANRGPRINLTDFDARIHKGKQGEYYPGYNAQAEVTPLVLGPAGEQGVLIVATDVCPDANDLHQFVPMQQQSEDVTGVRIPLTLMDSGYHSAANLAAAEARGQSVYMPAPKAKQVTDAYGKAQFVYDPATDTYRCPTGTTLRRQTHEIDRPDGKPNAIRYRASKLDCDACPVSVQCRAGDGNGRSVTVTEDEPRLVQHRLLMEDEQVQAIYAKRKEWSEPTFGTLKAVLGADRFHLRGLPNVRAEWSLLATAVNLRTLAARWASQRRRERRLAWDTAA